MLIFNPRRIFALRGVEKPSGFLAKNGFTAPTATKFLQAKGSMINISYLQKICLMMNCTPNDLFEWKPDATNKIEEDHALNSLRRAETVANIRELLKDLPVEKLSQVESLLVDLKNK